MTVYAYLHIDPYFGKQIRSAIDSDFGCDSVTMFHANNNFVLNRMNERLLTVTLVTAPPHQINTLIEIYKEMLIERERERVRKNPHTFDQNMYMQPVIFEMPTTIHPFCMHFT